VRSWSRKIIVDPARSVPWPSLLASPPALALLASALGVVAGNIAASGIRAPPQRTKPGYPIDAAPPSFPAQWPVGGDRSLPGATVKGRIVRPGEQEAGFRWTLRAGLRDAAHCPRITPEFRQGCLDAVTALSRRT